MRPYPKQYPPWKNGCYMWEPRGIPHGCRAPGVPFKMHIPNAIQVMVRAGNEWTELENVEEHVFQGLVDFSKPDMANGGVTKLRPAGRIETTEREGQFCGRGKYVTSLSWVLPCFSEERICSLSLLHDISLNSLFLCFVCCITPTWLFLSSCITFKSTATHG
ncbi:unnamed protein product [Acanthosepion pharaonis]|uniref:Uncharacterized protein n=1 Tax=Acanthosepion pharaonis TaxID=158019 RepID=A0A812B9N6_ACAPH|nr:unnamed protein product [Sepia pharaonis]